MRARGRRALRTSPLEARIWVWITACLGAPFAFLAADRPLGSRVTGVFGLLLTALVISGCQRTATPQRTAQNYAAALEQSDADAARALFSQEMRDERSDVRLDAEFERRVQASDSLTESLASAAEAPATLSAWLPFADIERLEMNLVNDQWVIVDGVLAPRPFSSPRDTLLALVRALNTQDANLLYELMPPEFRSETSLESLTAWMTDEASAIADTAQLLSLHASEPLSVSEDRAVLRYGSRTLVMRREAERWFVWDFD
jgi:hypothetical protein